ncbi:MAG TPA: methionyl-tRNA formyltransferase [Myxococcota bacterium]|jgi:methionyl-tRNA formyltransferase
MSEARAPAAGGLRLVFFGTPEFAVPTLAKLLAGRHPVVGVVSQPDRPRGRGRHTAPSPVSELAQRAGAALLRPERVASPEVEAELRRLAPDLGVVVAFGQFLPKRIRELPRLGYLINAHASLLPRHRGAAPIQRAILAGDRQTGVSVMRVEREMDTGAVALVRELEIGAEETGGELTQRIAAASAEAVAEAIEQIAQGRVRWTPQPEAGVTLAPKLSAADAALDFREGAEALVRRVRALAPSPGASTRIDGDRLAILAARAQAGPVDGEPGTLRRGSDPLLRIATGEGWLVPLVVQRAGGRALAIDAFLRGRPLPDGMRLGAGLDFAG